MLHTVADLHTHTMVSLHAFNTQLEMITRAKALGFQALAITDHGPKLPDGVGGIYFGHLIQLPHYMEGIFVLKGIEANVLDVSGRLDIPDRVKGKMDFVIASVHCNLIPELTCDEGTELWMNVAHDPDVDMIGHSDQAVHPYDYEAVCAEFAKCRKIVELNGASARVRPGSEALTRRLVLACKKCGTKVAVNSDAHSVYALGQQEHLLRLLEEVDFPQENLVNASMKNLRDELAAHGRAAAEYIVL